MSQSPQKPKPSVSFFLQDLQKKGGLYEEWFANFEELYNKRLWHQLSVKLFEFVQLEQAKKLNLVEIYENFISDFETKINQLTLVEIVIFIVKQISNPEEAIKFIQRVQAKVKSNQDAKVLCQILVGNIKLANNDIKGAKEVLREIEPVIDAQTGVTPVHGRYFKLSSQYFKVIGNHCKYYRDSLRYLGCLEHEKEPVPELHEKAFTLALAALLGETIYNFGELLQHPIINNLKNRDDWLIELLEAFNSGDLKRFMDLRNRWITQPDLAAHEIQLRQKISLFCLMELTFKSPNGVLTFDEISKHTYLPIDEIEHLVMKALSLNLVKGEIDEVEQKVILNWVQPRVLDKQQINRLKTRLDDWCKNIRKTENLLEQNAQEIIS